MIPKRGFFFCLIFLLTSHAWANGPMADVIELLDANGGIRTNTTAQEGYYVVSLGFSGQENEQKASEDARLSALRSLTEFITGVGVSGITKVKKEYLSKTIDGKTREFSQESFLDVIQTQFKGNLSAAKVVKEGRYNNQFFVAIMIAEEDTKKRGRLTTKADQRPKFADKDNTIKTVEAKGIASMLKMTKAAARETAIQSALRNAVQQANGVAVQGKSGRLGESVTMVLSTKSQGYVRSYEILDELEKNNDIIIDIVAEVDEGQLIEDARFYLDVFSAPKFAIKTNDMRLQQQLTNDLENLGFQFVGDASKATHLFTATIRQDSVINSKGVEGYATEYTLQLIDTETSAILLTIINPVNKTKIYIKPKARAKQISETSALRSLSQQLGPEIITALAELADYGRIYDLVIKNAKRSDLAIFKQVFNNGTSGNIEGWEWTEDEKTLTLKFRFKGRLSDAMDQGLKDLYATYKSENSTRRPSAINIGGKVAAFAIFTTK
jgi:hypothetical protein